MGRRFYIAGFLFGVIGVILGAFATHGLKPLLSPESIATFETGTRYQIYHALLLLILGGISQLKPRTKNWIFYLLIIGVTLFSGSIYLLATNGLTSFDFTVIALLTPLGGSLLILAWIILLWCFITLKKK